MKPLLLLDFDTTLFKTIDFWQDFAIVFAQFSNKPAQVYIDNYEDYTIGTGSARMVNYDKMLADVHVAPEVVRKAVYDAITQKSYLFDDAKRLVAETPRLSQQYDVAILTFGQPVFQQLKIDHVPELRNIPVHITQAAKTEYISSQFSDRPGGILVDDKPDQELPEGWTEIHIDRQASKHKQPEQLAPHIYRITTLDDVTTILALLNR